jgi:hypothetical protein
MALQSHLGVKIQISTKPYVATSSSSPPTCSKPLYPYNVQVPSSPIVVSQIFQVSFLTLGLGVFCSPPEMFFIWLIIHVSSSNVPYSGHLLPAFPILSVPLNPLHLSSELSSLSGISLFTDLFVDFLSIPNHKPHEDRAFVCLAHLHIHGTWNTICTHK